MGMQYGLLPCVRLLYPLVKGFIVRLFSFERVRTYAFEH
jgi:hypothetical protein